MAKVIFETKRDFYNFWDEGGFGINRPLTWRSIDEIESSGYSGLVCMRSKLAGGGGGKTEYNMTLSQAKKLFRSWVNGGQSADKITFNQSMPDEHLVIQGHVWRGLRGIELTYSTIKEPMNLALQEREEYASGAKSLAILREKLDDSSFGDLTTLIDLYSSYPSDPIITSHSKLPVVEFSTYDVSVGEIRGRNTVFWEIRHY